jgi:general secretion pathway protein I
MTPLARTLRSSRALPSQRQWRSCANHPRAGISLFEVLLALGIFLAAVVTLTQLSETGMRAAVQARLQTHAILRCESKLAEIATGVEPLEDVADQPFPDDENWVWSLESGAGPHTDLLQVTVTVEYLGETQLATAGFSLSRLIRDPAVFAAAAEADAAAAEEEAE